MAVEGELNRYQFKHHKRIFLDQYNGVAKDIMTLNDPVADGFMRVSDMRNDIVIVQKPQNRVRDYEDVGFVRVAKFLKMPLLDLWAGDGFVQVKRENDIWYIAVNDQDLANQVSKSDDPRKVDDKFVGAFRKEVNKGLSTCLKKEKLLNDGKYNIAFLLGYVNALSHTSLISVNLSELIKKPGFMIKESLYLAVVLVFLNIIYNLEARHNEKTEQPFVKTAFYEYFLPTVPIDRIARGTLYLDKHGNHLIEQVKK